MRELADTIIAYKLVWLRVFFYFFIPAGMLFLTQTETFGQQTWDEMGPFLKNRLYFACIMSGASGLVAYMDASMQRAREVKADLKKERDTDFLKKSELKP